MGIFRWGNTLDRMTLEDLFSLRGRRAIVTGASSGLGIEFAETLALAGADVVLVARREERLRELAAKLVTDHGVRAAIVAGDLGALEEIPALYRRCEEALGPVDVLVNNAGIFDPIRAERITLERWRKTIDLNLNAVFALCREFANARFAAKATGVIVNVGSVNGLVAGAAPGFAAYAAAKAGIANLGRQLAVEWGARGIRVNTLAPGFFPTELNDKDFEKPGVKERVLETIPLGRLGRGEELRPALLSLVSPFASYTNGSVVYVDGGLTVW